MDPNNEVNQNIASAYLEMLALEEKKKTEGLDAVNKDAVKKKFKDRKDKDIDNDGDEDESDEYLHNRRKTVSKEIDKDGDVDQDKPKVTSSDADSEKDNDDDRDEKGSVLKKDNDKKKTAEQTKESLEPDESGMTSAQKKKFDKLYKQMLNGPEHKKIMSKAVNKIKGDGQFHALVKKTAMESVDEENLKELGLEILDKMSEAKKVMDHDKENADRKKAVKVYKDIRKGKYPGVKFAKESVELDEFELDESLKKHMSPYDAKEFLKKHNAHNKDFHGLPSSVASAMHDKAKELKYKKSRTSTGSTGRMFHAALQKHADSYKGARESVEPSLLMKRILDEKRVGDAEQNIDTWDKQVSNRRADDVLDTEMTEKEFMDMHNIDTPEFVDGPKVANKTMDAIKNSVKSKSATRNNDSTIGESAELDKDENDMYEAMTPMQRALAKVKAQPKDKVSVKKAPWDKDDVKKESVDLGENNWKKLNDTSNYFKMLALDGMGTETNKSISKVGTELEYLDTKSGKKHKGVITKIDGKGYEVIKVDNLEAALKLISAKKERFTFYNMDKADKIIGSDKDDRSK
jgi:hypothetical protein